MYKVGDKVRLNKDVDYELMYHNETYIITSMEEKDDDDFCYIVSGANPHDYHSIYVNNKKVHIVDFTCTCGSSVCNNCREYRRN